MNGRRERSNKYEQKTIYKSEGRTAEGNAAKLNHQSAFKVSYL